MDISKPLFRNGRTFDRKFGHKIVNNVLSIIKIILKGQRRGISTALNPLHCKGCRT